MKSMNIREARSALGRLDRLLAEEGEITITRHGRPIARLLAVAGAARMPSHADLRGRLRPLRRPSEDLVRADRDAR
jgi:prevent-host-death family protein